MARPVPGPLAPGERDPDILSASQVAERLGFLGARAVTDLAAAGELPGTKVGGTWLFTWPAIRAWRTLRWAGIYRGSPGPAPLTAPSSAPRSSPGAWDSGIRRRSLTWPPPGSCKACKIGRDLAVRLGGDLPADRRPRRPRRPVIGAAELAGRLGFRDPQTVTDLAAAGELQGCKIGGTWLFAWAAIYQQIAGPGVPDGPVFSAAQLGRWLGASAPAVRRAAAPPGTPGGLPGCKVGKQWLFALEAVRLRLAGPPEVPGTPGGGAADMAAGAAGRTPLR